MHISLTTCTEAVPLYTSGWVCRIVVAEATSTFSDIFTHNVPKKVASMPLVSGAVKGGIVVRLTMSDSENENRKRIIGCDSFTNLNYLACQNLRCDDDSSTARTESRVSLSHICNFKYISPYMRVRQWKRPENMMALCIALTLYDSAD